MRFIFGVGGQSDLYTNAAAPRYRHTMLTMERVAAERDPELDFYVVNNLPPGHQAYIEQDSPGWRARLWMHHQEHFPTAQTLYRTPADALWGLERQVFG